MLPVNQFTPFHKFYYQPSSVSIILIHYLRFKPTIFIRLLLHSASTSFVKLDLSLCILLRGMFLRESQTLLSNINSAIRWRRWKLVESCCYLWSLVSWEKQSDRERCVESAHTSEVGVRFIAIFFLDELFFCVWYHRMLGLSVPFNWENLWENKFVWWSHYINR